MLRKLESLTLFVAAVLAVGVESSFLYWIWLHPARAVEAQSSSYVGQWISPTLPQWAMIGALLGLFYYAILTVRPPDREKALQNHRTFLRLWYWFLALASVQGCALYVSYSQVVHP